MGPILALLSSLFWGTADFCGGVLTKRVSLIMTVAISQLAALGAVVVACVVTDSLTLHRALLWAVLAGVIDPAVLALYYWALSKGPMGVVGPLSSLAGVVPVMVGLFGGEHLSGLELAGLVGCILGVALLSMTDVKSITRAKLSTIAVALLCAFGFGLLYVCLAKASTAGVLQTLLVQRIVSVGLVMISVVSLSKGQRPGGIRMLQLAAVGICDVTANGLFAWSSHFGELAVVGALGAIYPVATVGLAMGFLHEHLTRIQLVGALVTLAGVVLVSAR